MSVRDTSIVDWNTDDTQNVPTDGTLVGRDLPRQVRNLKSVIRDQYDDPWMALPFVPTYVSASSFTVPGDETTLLNFFNPLRLNAGAGSQSFGFVADTNYNGGDDVTEVTMEMLSGTVPPTLTRVDLGMDVTAHPYYEFSRRGTLDVTGAVATATLTFASLGIQDMPRSKYNVLLTVTATDGAPVAGAFTIKTVSTSTTAFTITVITAPGGGNTVTYDWVILYPQQTVNHS